jgi:arylsulfatase A-like enzyme
VDGLISRRTVLGGLTSAVVAPGPRGLGARAATGQLPNIILCMADDQGWGDVGYRGHPVLKTPVLDEMAASGLRFERFYAAAPVCSPTRGSVLTGRHPNRYGCFSWGHTLRPQEVTIAEALKPANYATGHFGKWHVGPVRADSPVCPGASGFDEWLASPNFFENDPLMSHKGRVVQTRGEGSQVTVDAAIEFIRGAASRKQPFLVLVWFGSPHAPHEALDQDRRLYADQPEKLQHFYGEITAMDRAIGRLRRELRTLGIAENTLFWYNSDNGAIPVGSTGGLAGGKGTVDEGGIRVPGIIEWPARIGKPRTSFLPCGTVDIYPTLVEIAGVRVRNQVQPLDGISLVPLIGDRTKSRRKPLGFWVYPVSGIGVNSTKLLEEMRTRQAAGPPEPDPGKITGRYPEENLPGPAAWIDGDYKLHRRAPKEVRAEYKLFDLNKDPQEKTDLAAGEPQRVERMKGELADWQRSVIRSLNGEDYSRPGTRNGDPG